MQFYKRNNDSLPGGNVLEVYDLMLRKKLAFSNFNVYSISPTSFKKGEFLHNGIYKMNSLFFTSN